MHYLCRFVSLYRSGWLSIEKCRRILRPFFINRILMHSHLHVSFSILFSMRKERKCNLEFWCRTVLSLLLFCYYYCHPHHYYFSMCCSPYSVGRWDARSGPGVVRCVCRLVTLYQRSEGEKRQPGVGGRAGMGTERKKDS